MQPIRRRKKRPNYGVRTVEVCRSGNGFGFTISGQQPCILSCIVPNSPAEKAGLRPGDYLIAVSGQNVSKVPHDDVVQLIGSCYGVLKLQIAENYYSDSSEEDFITTVRQKPKYHKYKSNVQTHPPGLNKISRLHDIRMNNNYRSCSAVNLSASNVKPPDIINEQCDMPPFYLNAESEWVLQSVVGYLGTIEMPRKLTPVSRLQIIRGCIKRLRSEKRNYTGVLMTVYPCSLRLKNDSGTTIAVYPGGRVTYCSANSEQDRKYFGIVTTSLEEEPSNSCHVFVMLSSTHEDHVKETVKFKLNCKKDDGTGMCEQFPTSCDSIIAAVQKYYENDDRQPVLIARPDGEAVLANSPLPSNDSTTTSNSDSGIGFRDDSGHQSDRILVVDIQNQRLHIQAAGNADLQYIDCTDHASVRDDTRTSDCFHPPPPPPPPPPISRNISFPEFFPSNERNWCHDNCDKLLSAEECENDSDDRLCIIKGANESIVLGIQKADATSGNIKNSSSEIMLLNKLTGNQCGNFTDKYCISHSLEDLKSHPTEMNEIEVSENMTRKHSLQDVSVFSGSDNQETSDHNTNYGNTNTDKPKVENKATEWALSLERLLHDTIGIQVFAEFLKKEFSVENVYFWAACEKYQLLTDADERKSLAYNIHEKYLSNDATDPVNVDSSCQQLTQQQLNSPNTTLFHQAQKQIFNLMKFDCYPRFLKSNLYKNCLLNELTEDTLTTMNIKFDSELIIAPVLRKNNQDDVDKQCRSSRRRRSIMPWSRSRCKSRDRSSNDNISSSSGSRGSLSSWDLTLPISLCRVILPDGSTAVLNIQLDQSVRSIIGKLLEKRSYSYTAFQVISTANDKVINLEESSSVLSGKEVKIEWRVEFILDLPNRKSLVIKSKPTHSLAAVLTPILINHGYSLQMVTLCLISENEVIEPTSLVSSVDKQRVQVLTRSTPVPNMQGFSHPDFAMNSKCGNLDEITNKVFEELLQGKAENFRTNKIAENAASVHSEEWGSEHSSGILGRFLRRDSFFPDKHRRIKKCTMDTTNTTDKKHINILPPITTKWRAVSKLDHHLEKEGLYEDLKRAQRGRLDDQRGTEINIELPDFLKDKENVLCNRKKLRKIRKDCNSEECIKNNGIVRSTNECCLISNNNNAMRNDCNTIAEINNNSNDNYPHETEIGDPPESAISINELRNSDKCGNNNNTNNKVYQQITADCLQDSGNNTSINNSNNTNNNNYSICNNNNNNVNLLNIEPPPLPPKPKNISCSWRSVANNNPVFCQKNIYLDQPNSSFV